MNAHKDHCATEVTEGKSNTRFGSEINQPGSATFGADREVSAICQAGIGKENAAVEIR